MNDKRDSGQQRGHLQLETTDKPMIRTFNASQTADKTFIEVAGKKTGYHKAPLIYGQTHVAIRTILSITVISCIPPTIFLR